jgi:hypothetical protein
MDLVWFTDDLLTTNATDKIKKEKQENQVTKENMKAKTKQRLFINLSLLFCFK